VFITKLFLMEKDDLLGTWDSSGVWFRSSGGDALSGSAGLSQDQAEGDWIKLAEAAQFVACGNLAGNSTDDLVGAWDNSGVWMKLGTTGSWIRLSFHLPVSVTTGDMNGDGKDDLVGSWANSGTYYRDSEGGGWTKIAEEAKLVGAGKYFGKAMYVDLFGAWANSGVWVRKSLDGSWTRLSYHLPDDLAVGDMNGDGRDDLIGTWSASGTYWRDSETGTWTQIGEAADLVAAGDVDGDGLCDFFGAFGYSGVWSKTTADQNWTYLSSSIPRDIAAGKLTGGTWGTNALLAPGPISVSSVPLTKPWLNPQSKDLAEYGPGGSLFHYSIQKEHIPREVNYSGYIPGPGEPGFVYVRQKNLKPRENKHLK
jgi:hypothetical protein